MITVCCVRQGTAYSPEYVEILLDSVRRNLPDGFVGRFVCLTDRPEDLVNLKGLELRLLTPSLHGWWSKMDLFRPGQWARNERVWYFDLDTVITGPLEHLFKYAGAFGILEDVYRPGGLQSSVMSFIGATTLIESIWLLWHANGCPKPACGDQAWLEAFWAHILPNDIQGKAWPPDVLQKLFPGVLRSYKVDCVWQIPKSTSVVFFHGRPRPHEVKTGWVPHIWKVNGGSQAEIVQVGTIDQHHVLDNVASAVAAGYDQLAATHQHEKTAIICGGGPSLAEHLMLIANLRRDGAIVYSCNNIDALLREAHIEPHFHVMMDARPEVLAFVNPGGIKLYASMCDPTVLKEASEYGNLVIWHPATSGIDRVLGKAMLIAGGSTVGMHALCLAYAMGFKNVLLFGFDSCYAGDAHHAYSQALNDGEQVYDCVVNGAKFKAAAWMVQQCDDFRQLAPELANLGVQLTIFGDHMLAAVAKSMRNSPVVELDGFLWPANDTQARKSILGTLDDLNYYIELCGQRRTAVQAGGNVGIWPKELAKHFKRVVTAEPDFENFNCLVHNVKEANVDIMPVAFGAMPGLASISRETGNCGASYVREGADFEVITIDSLQLTDVDLIQLDVEGFELMALQGAAETIWRDRPIIVLELKDLGTRFGYSEADVDAWLAKYEYERIGVAHRDVIYRSKHGRPN